MYVAACAYNTRLTHGEKSFGFSVFFVTYFLPDGEG